MFLFYIQFYKGSINISKQIIMHKGTLVDILFETNETTSNDHKLIYAQNQNKQIIRKQYENIFKKSHVSNRVSKIIKITQFNSSLVIGDDKMHQNRNNNSVSISPNKSFNIKKLSDAKNKIATSAKKWMQNELKNKQKNMNIQLNKYDDSKKPIQKILVTTRCNIKKQLSDIQLFTSQILDIDNKVTSDRSYEQYVYDFFNNNKKQLKKSRQILNQTKIINNIRNNSGFKIDNIQSIIRDQELSPRKIIGSPRRKYSKYLQQQKKYQQLIQRQKRQMLQLKKQLNKNYGRPFNPPQNITAYSYIIYEADAKKNKILTKLSLFKEQNIDLIQTRKALLNSHKVIAAENSRSQVQIASLTKIMTCILALDLAKKYNLKLNQQFVTIGQFQQNIGGTSAHIKKGQIYNIQQLLYGLMLPSGNDASLAIAVWGGRLLLQKQPIKSDIMGSTVTTQNSVLNFKKKDCYERFIFEMNIKANELNMDRTRYVNSHGLSNFDNKSCAFDLALLCEYAMGNKQFREIVSCKIYETVINLDNEINLSILKKSDSNQKYDHQKILIDNSNTSLDGTLQMQQMKDCELINDNYNEQQLIEDRSKSNMMIKQIRWQNSHRLLHDKPNLYIGIKTGVTNTAGPCLASCIQIHGKRYILIVLNCKSMRYRFKDTQVLRRWLFNKEQIKYKQQLKVDKMDRVDLMEQVNN